MPAVGMNSILRGIERRQNQPEICYEIARELRAEMIALQSEMSGPVAGRPRKKEQDRREARIIGMKFALGLALGIPPDFHREAVDSFLEVFRQERLNALQDGNDGQAEARSKALAAESQLILRSPGKRRP